MVVFGSIPSRVSLVVLAAGTLLFAACQELDLEETHSPVPIEYPVEHYRITNDPVDFVRWKAEVRKLRTDLRELYPYEGRQPVPKGTSREVTFLDEAVDPASIILRDPAAFWREPATLSWWELIDESGEIQKVLVISSNQNPETDRRIIGWCLEGKSWGPAIVDGKPTASIRSASINLGSSKWHISYLQKKISEPLAGVIGIVLITLVVRGAVSLLNRFRRH